VAFQFFLAYQIIFIIFGFCYLLFLSRKVLIDSIKKYYWLYLGSLIPLSFYILAQIKFKFMGLISLLVHLTKGRDSSKQLLPYLTAFGKNLIENLAANFTFYNFTIARWFLIVFALTLVYFIFKKKHIKIIIFLLIWLISPLIIYPLGNNDTYFLNIGIIYPLSMLVVYTCYILVNLFNQSKTKRVFLVIIFSLIAFSNLFLIITKNKGGEFLFSVQYKQNLSDEKKIIDYLYTSSDRKIFAFNTLTNPLYVNTTWAYLFNWYGKKKYGYMPVWLGAYLDDFGKEIEFSEVQKLAKESLLYLIIEPPVFHQDYVKAYSKFEDTRSKLIEKRIFGTHIVEKRQILEIKGFSRDELSSLLQK